jgi:hypothetical protein
MTPDRDGFGDGVQSTGPVPDMILAEADREQQSGAQLDVVARRRLKPSPVDK